MEVSRHEVSMIASAKEDTFRQNSLKYSLDICIVYATLSTWTLNALDSSCIFFKSHY